MSEEEVQEDGAEPSMEDILASIRRILAEDEEGGEEDAPAEAAAAAPEPEDDFDEDDMDMEAALAQIEEEEAVAAAAPEPEPEPAPQPEPAPEPVAQPAPVAAAPAPEPVYAPPQPAPAAFVPPPAAQQSGDIFELTQTMVASPEEVMSTTTMKQSSDMLADLARAILDRRDLKVVDEGSDANITLESLVREMLKPLLSEWMERNLPYMIERLVKKEIDKMVNRAQRLDDY